MASKKDKDAENGLQVIAILGRIWTIGFFYLAWDGALADIGMGQLSITCCNVFNVLLTIIFLASWLYTKRENKIKDYLEQYFKKYQSVPIEHLIDKFRLSKSSAIKALSIWAIETSVKGEYDVITGIYSKKPEPVPEDLAFCPNCGNKLEIIGPDKPDKCDECGVSF